MAPQPQPDHRCKQTRVLALCGLLLMASLGWLFHTVQASEVERAVLKTRLERMGEDISAIRTVLEQALRRKDAP